MVFADEQTRQETPSLFVFNQNTIPVKKNFFYLFFNLWLLLFLCTIICLIFGYLGYSEIRNQFPDGRISDTDIFYKTIQLFVLESGDIQNPPIYLEFVRFFAPLLTLYAIVLIFIRFFYDYFRELSLIFRRNPKVIIFGLGYLGPVYLREFQRRGYYSIGIEKDKTSITRISHEYPGSFFIQGDGTDPHLIKRLHIKKHDALIIVT
jgi:hypothetical protein